MSLKYRADIDGLRAIAVLSVIFFHTDITGFSGGFVGVDIFFVISGFLITSIILKDIKSGYFSISNFYERRIRRIFPALFPVIFFTLLIGSFTLDYKTFKSLGQSITATTLFSSNILFLKDSGYFDTPSLQKPLLHTWSLAVEEQFYIFFPLLLIGINRFFNKKFLQYLIIIATISLLTSIWGIYNQPSATFYLVHTRAWELLTGSILALKVIREPKSYLLRNLLSFAGLTLIIYSVGFYSKSTAFPGINAIIPVLGAAFIIYSGTGGSSIVNRLISIRPMVFTGLISYSLYLWHWPLIVFAKYMVFRDLNNLEISAIILSSFILATLSLKYIEKPFRGIHSIFYKRKSVFVFSWTIIGIFSLIGLTIHLQNGMPYRSEANAIIYNNDNEYEWKKGVTLEEHAVKEITKGNSPPIIGTANTSPVFILWGDSHARMLSSILTEKAIKYNISGYLATNSGSPPIVTENNDESFINGAYFNTCVINFIKNHSEIKTVIIASMWNAYGNDTIESKENDILSWKPTKDKTNKNRKANSVLLKNGILNTINILHNLGRNIVIVSDVPKIDGDALRLYCVNSLTGSDYNELLPTESKYRKSNQAVYDLFLKLKNKNNITLVDPESMLFDKNKRTILTINNKLLYRDNNHLSDYGAKIIAPVFDNTIINITHSHM
ncbi:MAG: acyltransferase family protein [Chlorobiaceae bacterium]